MSVLVVCLVPLFAFCVLDSKSDINEADDRGWTPLMHAARAGNYAVAEALLSRGHQVDVTWRNHYGHSAVDIAMFYRHKDVYTLLTNFGMLT